jgi:hypothetical protein
MMQDGEKKLKEFMRERTQKKRDAISYLLNCLHNKNLKKKSIGGVKQFAGHRSKYKKVVNMWKNKEFF